jgi:hypothetical protein
MKEPIRESRTIMNGIYAVQKIASMIMMSYCCGARLGDADMFAREDNTDAPEKASVSSFDARTLNSKNLERVTRLPECGIHRREFPPGDWRCSR